MFLAQVSRGMCLKFETFAESQHPFIVSIDVGYRWPASDILTVHPLKLTLKVTVHVKGLQILNQSLHINLPSQTSCMTSDCRLSLALFSVLISALESTHVTFCYLTGHLPHW